MQRVAELVIDLEALEKDVRQIVTVGAKLLIYLFGIEFYQSMHHPAAAKLGFLGG
jgi:hypothetical protein